MEADTGSPAPVLRPAEADALGRFDERTLDQDRVGDHRVEHFVVGDIGARQAELVGERLLRAQALARADPRAVVQRLEFVAGRRIFQIFVDPHVAARVAQDFERLARRSAHRVVINCRFHFGSSFLAEFKGLNKRI